MARFYYFSLIVTLSLSAQIARTSLNGTVTDEQGRRIPAARIQATNVATGLRHEIESNPQGTYAMPELEPGTFAVEIAKPGFESVRFRNVRLEVGQPRTLDVALAVAERKEQIGVSEAEFQLDRVDATVGGPIEQKQVDELPINGRNWSTLTSLVPGAVDTGAGDQICNTAGCRTSDASSGPGHSGSPEGNLSRAKKPALVTGPRLPNAAANRRRAENHLRLRRRPSARSSQRESARAARPPRSRPAATW